MLKLSIITVTYNNEEGLMKTIHSVNDQSEKDFEYIIVDGGSSDNTEMLVKSHSDLVNVFISEKDNGIYDAMNKGIVAAQGEYCLFLNAGDCFYDLNVIKKVIPHLENIDIAYGDSYKIKPHYRRKITYSDSLTLMTFYKVTPPIHHQATFIKRDLFEKYGFYNIELPIFADWEFFYRVIILNHVSTLHLRFIVCSFDGTGVSNSISIENPKRKQINNLRYEILKSHIPDYILKDYEYFDKIISKVGFFRKLKNKFSYFSIKK